MLKHSGKHLLFLVFNFIHSIKILILAQQPLMLKYCVLDSTYSTNSTFRTNLDRTLVNLPTTNSGYGFFNSSSGQNPDTANAIALCRGDTEPVECVRCVNSSILQLRQGCPNQTEARIYLERCMLKYSNDDILGKSNERYPIRDPSSANVTDPVSFNQDLLSLMANLSTEAANGGLLKYATGTTTRPNAPMAYGLVQCIPSLSNQECAECLRDAVSQMSGCCYGRLYARVLLSRCHIRYEHFRFFDDLAVQPPPTRTQPSESDIPGGKNTIVIRKSSFIVVVMTTTTVFVIIVATLCIFVMRREKKMTQQSSEQTEPINIPIVETLEYQFSRIREATDDFSEECKIGQGGFGPVYKGKLEDGRLIAVKRRSLVSKQGEPQFRKELALLSKLHHRNLVVLLGYSLEENEKVLIYEFLPNGSLDKFLFDRNKRALLDWNTSFKIIEDIARGLIYLHEGSRPRIIHRDLKASNVLLDAQLNAKITDFGMARMFSADETQGTASKLAGTYGYMAPEYVLRKRLSVKSDVYSFGVLVLEIITGKSVHSFTGDDLLSYAWRNCRNGTPSEIIDPILKQESNSKDDIFRSIYVALHCVHENVTDRPPMSKVVLMLNTSFVTPQLPSKPLFITDTSTDQAMPAIEEHDASESEEAD